MYTLLLLLRLGVPDEPNSLRIDEHGRQGIEDLLSMNAIVAPSWRSGPFHPFLPYHLCLLFQTNRIGVICLETESRRCWRVRCINLIYRKVFIVWMRRRGMWWTKKPTQHRSIEGKPHYAGQSCVTGLMSCCFSTPGTYENDPPWRSYDWNVEFGNKGAQLHSFSAYHGMKFYWIRTTLALVGAKWDGVRLFYDRMKIFIAVALPN